jgi:hypothetical protein
MSGTVAQDVKETHPQVLIDGGPGSIAQQKVHELMRLAALLN